MKVKGGLNQKRLWKKVDAIYSIYKIPNFDRSIIEGQFEPEYYPSWLDNIEFVVKGNDDELFLVAKNKSLVPLNEGTILVYNNILKEIEDIQPDEEEFLENYF